MSSGSFNNFQTLLDQQVGSLQKPSSWPPLPVATDNRNTQKRIPAASLRFQSAAWVTAGGGMAATLAGVRRIFRNFRGLKYF
ncbi:hypothetical protein N7466_000657 [Penicillium verhagenii]|uniref:uncharacterized protein n=1 Tax=Penicillium verhagenii TaxID=1562060 RepID=UPI0025457753|nr:uncharacterized protein N7466_000657 [Penicillium verhagenii]KAJ5947642.1 hypothetical protein N7466_000657 [Penicillium verhagenii]